MVTDRFFSVPGQIQLCITNKLDSVTQYKQQI